MLTVQQRYTPAAAARPAALSWSSLLLKATGRTAWTLLLCGLQTRNEDVLSSHTQTCFSCERLSIQYVLRGWFWVQVPMAGRDPETRLGGGQRPSGSSHRGHWSYFMFTHRAQMVIKKQIKFTQPFFLFYLIVFTCCNEISVICLRWFSWCSGHQHQGQPSSRRNESHLCCLCDFEVLYSFSWVKKGCLHSYVYTFTMF